MKWDRQHHLHTMEVKRIQLIIAEAFDDHLKGIPGGVGFEVAPPRFL
jgi:hypothetical protein